MSPTAINFLVGLLIGVILGAGGIFALALRLHKAKQERGEG